MELFLALLMTVAAVSYPVFVDIRRHGTKNILKITAQDVDDWVSRAQVMVALNRLAAPHMPRVVVISKLILILAVVVLLLLELIWWLL